MLHRACYLFYFTWIGSAFTGAFTLPPPIFSARVTPTFSSAVYSSSAATEEESAVKKTTKKRQEDYARGAALLLENVAISRGPAQILKSIDWRVEPRTKWALIGGNGSGKSTLLKAVAGEILYDGDIHLGGGDIGYLQQTAVSGSTKTVYEEAASGMVELQKAKDYLERIQQQLANADDDNGQDNEKLLQELDRANTLFEAAGGYTQEQKVATVLKGLGFHDLDIRCDELSGGWQMRGNHLDAAARKWLANYLATYDGDGTMLLVTHDVQLLESMDHIAEITPTGNLQVYKSCTYPQYLELKQQRALASRAEFERNQVKAAKLQGFVDKWGASATKASAAQSRVKQLEKMGREGLLDEPDEAIVAERFKPTLVLPDPPRAIGDTLLALNDASVGYDNDKPLVEGVNLEIVRGMKLLIRGPNGAGKSTLLHSLRGTLPLIEGERTKNAQLELGVFTQDLAQELDGESRAVDIVTQYARTGFDVTISDEQARGVMGRLGLTGEKALRRIKELSGGEKARVALSNFSIKPSNCILLDEVSNHLDQECVEALSDALTDWGKDDGAVVVISHDKEFCSKVGFTHVATVSDGKFKLEQRSMRNDDWQVVRTTLGETDKEGTETGQPAKVEVDPAIRKKLFNAPKRISKLEELLEKTEEEIASLDEEMLANGSDVGKLVDLSKKKEELEAKVEEYMEEWEELEMLLAESQ
ncbi:Tylosin resistance ATP-binding protein TlrC [Seminavis robusta]|uniref:Tylosin resistance ATP-binding protein TlrC n=1 Tax=Seminavis robusta TaxID=568900 RepID=A0A9N8DR49_9STRA|nr:Tylosin resistance ATP-binding protein TlrC [Seminavis robusta]|eukprot:Sro221_g091110.1 Tylosin resistance ATP-binding protein TlrC (703) ;mRNA; r:76683-79238